jgi:hypothetical protein
MVLAIISASVPALYARCASRESHQEASVERVESRVSVEKISSPRYLDSTTITRVPDEWTRISLDRPARPKSARIDETVGRTKRESVRQSWRSAMSDVGVAV